MGKVCGSPEEADQLIHEIERTVYALKNHAEQLTSDVQQARSWIRDDSFEDMKSVTKMIVQGYLSALPELKTTRDLLTRYVAFLRSIDSLNKTATANAISHASGIKTNGTAQMWQVSGGHAVYDSPAETGNNLLTNQGQNQKGFLGTCGLVATANLLRLSGKVIAENSVVLLAANQQLCETRSKKASENGGTNCKNRQALLSLYGVESELVPQNVDALAQAVGQGKGVLASVDVYHLYPPGTVRRHSYHCILITSVRYNYKNEVEGFYVCDSNADALGHTGGKYYSSNQMKKALTSNYANVTKRSIR